jgi:alpha-N-arabinofuranosidase
MIMKRNIFLILFMVISVMLSAQKSTMKIYPEKGERVIHKEIYGQFAEHLGTCIYGGIWVGENSPIPNINGYRTDVVDALRALKVPVVRWPGGCFADEYHWMDGIGPKDKRPKMVNTNWGGTIEDNSFGTHEFLNFCELLGIEPYISGNVGSGTVEELAKWVEYMTSDGDSPMANLRRKNGRDKPWKVKYLGIGNESWGCGGNMRPEFYADQYRRYQTYCKNYGGNHLYKIASGASDYDFNWTEVLMRNVGNRMNGLSLHYYTVKGWNGSKGSATNFNLDEYYRTLDKALGIEEVIKKHIEIMDKYDPNKRIGLLVDEWGTWWDEEPGTVSGHLYQQNSLRDAFVASLTLDIFHKYTDRITMANIAQMVNVLQAMILTNDKGIILTPTYYVFKMYNVHQDATFLPFDLTSDMISRDGKNIPSLSGTASRDKNGLIHISLSNVDPDKDSDVTIDLGGVSVKSIKGEILTSKNLVDHNTFDNPGVVKTVDFKGAKIVSGGSITVKVPAKSIITLEVK